MLTAVVLSHNNSDTIARALMSVSFAEEIIVFDDASTDDTRDIAKKHKARVYNRKVDGDFAAQRNAALDVASGEWVLFIDSDEVVTPELKTEIQSTIVKAPSNVIGYTFRRDDFFLGKRLQFGETGEVVLLRLARKTAGRWKRPVHEYWDIPGETYQMKYHILHYSHPTIGEFIDDINMYTTLNARYLYSTRTRIPAWHLVVYPIGKFLQDYLWYGGFLDGMHGAVFALLMSFHSFLTRAKTYLLWRHDTST